MVLFATTGELGAGKTLTLTFLAWHNWFNKRRRIFSNYNLYGFPFTKVNSIPSLEEMSNGFFAGDELWLWLNSWESRTKKSSIVSSILLKSRKRDVVICFTTQGIGQVVKRVRDIVDFVAYPIMSPDNRACKVIIMRGGSSRPSPINQPPLYFNTESVYAMYDTREEILPIDDSKKAVFKETFLNIHENRTFINDYLKKHLGFSDEVRMKSFCNAIQSSINPKNIRSESERKDKVESMSAI